MSKYKKSLLLGISTMTLLTGCQNRPIDTGAIETNRPLRNEAVNYLNEPSMTTLEFEPNSFWTQDYDRGERLPSIKVGPVDADDISVFQLLQLVAARAGVGIVPDKNLENKTITIKDPNKRDLQEFLEIISRRTGMFWEYRNNLISFDASKRFVVKVPRVEGSLLTISDSFRNLGANEVFVDEITGTITFTADYRAYKQAQQFLRTFELNRETIVYDIWVFEKTLRRGEGAGIWWDKLSRNISGTNVGFPSINAAPGGGVTPVGPGAAAGGLQFGIISNASGTIVNLLLQAMSEDSQTETVARPTLTMNSGGTSEFRVGERRLYIGTVNNTTASAVNGATTQGVQPDLLETGIVLRIAGASNDGVINTKIDLSIEELVRFEVFSTGGGQDQGGQSTTGTTGAVGNAVAGAINAVTGTTPTANAGTPNGGTTLRLPYTTNRTLRTLIDARPGDLVVLGGLISGRAETADRRFYRTTVPLADQQNLQRTETIIFMKPRLIRFRPRGTPSISRDEIRVAPGVGRNVRTEQGPLIQGRDPRAEERAARDLSRPLTNVPPVNADPLGLPRSSNGIRFSPAQREDGTPSR